MSGKQHHSSPKKGKKKYPSNYVTPKGKDERVYPMPDRFKYLEDMDVKCLKYGHTLVLQGGGYSTSVFDEIRKKQNNNESVVVAATGYPGKGKTYGVIRLCQKLDKKFHINDIPPPEVDDGQIAFSREHLDYLTGENTPLKRGQVIVIDEAHYGVGARKWGDREQQEIVDHIAAIRSKGFLLFLVVLHTEMIDKILRKFVFNYEFNFPKRGQATCYRKYFPMFSKEPHVKRLGRVNLLLPDEQLCNALDCFKCKKEYLDLKDEHPETRCMTIRAIYERRKEWFLNHAKDKEEEEKPNPYNTKEEALEWAIENMFAAPRPQYAIIEWLKDNKITLRHTEYRELAKKISDMKKQTDNITG